MAEWRGLVREGFWEGESFGRHLKQGNRGISGLGMSCSIQKDTQWKEQVVCRGRANIFWTRTESQDQCGEQKEQVLKIRQRGMDSVS